MTFEPEIKILSNESDKRPNRNLSPGPNIKFNPYTCCWGFACIE